MQTCPQTLKSTFCDAWVNFEASRHPRRFLELVGSIASDYQPETSYLNLIYGTLDVFAVLLMPLSGPKPSGRMHGAVLPSAHYDRGPTVYREELYLLTGCLLQPCSA